MYSWFHALAFHVPCAHNSVHGQCMVCHVVILCIGTGLRDVHVLKVFSYYPLCLRVANPEGAVLRHLVSSPCSE